MIRIDRSPDGAVEVTAEVVVGVQTRTVLVPLGRTTLDVDPAGLRNAPVVVLIDPALEPFARAGAERAGRASVATAVLADARDRGRGLIEAAATAEVVIAVTVAPEGATETLVVARALGGRPLPVIPFEDRLVAGTMLEGCWIDLDVAIPAIDGAGRERARAISEGLGLFESHHVVEVDPRPGLRSSAVADASLGALAAAATGVLAGRIAAGNRRWR